MRANTGPRRRRWPLALAGLAAVSAIPSAASLAAAPQARVRIAPTSSPRHPVDPADRVLRTMTLEQKVGQLFVTYAHGRSAAAVSPADAAANRSEYGVDTPAQVVAKYHLGGVVYFDWADNIGDPRQIAELSNGLQRAAGDVPLQIGVDQEQGLVNRIGPPATQFPGNMALGAAGDQGDTRLAARITGDELAALGVNQDYAPVADVNVNQANPVIGIRSFGADPTLVSRLTGAAVHGYQDDAGLIATAKHFPGHGDTDTDSHTGLPVIHHSRDQWGRLDEPPFAAAVAAGADSIMSAHIVVPALDPSGEPATLSAPILTGLLRGRLGYQGVIITDSLQMAGVRQRYPDEQVPVRALAAGADQLLMPPNMDTAYQAVLAAVRDGRISVPRLDASVLRVLRLKERRGLFQRRQADPARAAAALGTPAHLAAARAVAEHAVTLLRDQGRVLPLAPRRRVFVVGANTPGVAALAAEITRHGDVTSRQVTGANPDWSAIGAAVGAARRADVTVLVTHDVAGSAGQRSLIAQLTATRRPLVLVAVGSPYDAAYAPGVAGYLATYASTPVALAAAARTVCGEVYPSAHLPVAIADPRGQVLYRVGAGLRYDSHQR